MTPQEAHDLAVAIAKVNRHPDPEWWASRVQDELVGTEQRADDDIAPEPAPQA